MPERTDRPAVGFIADKHRSFHTGTGKSVRRRGPGFEETRL